MRFLVLGPLSVVTDREVLELRPGKLNSVLAALLLRPGQTASAEYLCRAVWDLDPPERHRAALHSSIMRLRHQLADLGAPSDLIATTPHGYRINLAPGQLDLSDFRTVRDEAAGTTDAAQRLDSLRVALRRWVVAPTYSDPLLNVPSVVLHRDLVPVMVEEWKQVAERYFDLEMEIGTSGRVIGDLHAATRAYPTHEGFAAQLARALWTTGRQQEALAEIRRTRDLLRSELGLSPGEDLRRLEADILRGDLPRRLPDRRTTPALRPGHGADPRPSLVGPETTRPGLGIEPAVEPVVGPRPGGPVTGAVGCANRRRLDERVRAALPLHGRASEVSALVEALEPVDRGGVVVVSGAPGVGKSALVAAVVARVADRFPGGVEVRCACDGDREPVLAAPGARLVVIEDADPEAADTHRALAGPGTWVLLVSRFGHRALTCEPGVAVVPIRPLDAAASAHLARAVVGSCSADDPTDRAADHPTRERAALARLGNLCGGFPGAITQAASRLRLSRDRDIDGFVTWLGADPVRRLSLSRDPRHSLALAFENHLGRLHPATAAAFHSLATADCTDLDVAEAAELLDVGELEAEIALEELVDACLVEVDGAGRYAFLDLARAVAVSQSRRSHPTRIDLTPADRRRA